MSSGDNEGECEPGLSAALASVGSFVVTMHRTTLPSLSYPVLVHSMLSFLACGRVTRFCLPRAHTAAAETPSSLLL